MSRKPTLFYSKKCQHCAEVLNKIRMAGANFGSNFDYILIDGNRNLPSFLREVPTLVAPGYPQPMTGEAVFMWIDTQIRRNNSMNQPQASQQRMAPMSNQPGPQQGGGKVEGAIATAMDGLSFYNPMEMSGFGDNYMSLEEGTDNQEHCFVFLDEQGNKQIQCFPAGQGPMQASGAGQGPSAGERPAWLQPQNVGRQQQQDVGPMKYNPNMGGGGAGQGQFHPSQFGTPMTMSQQNNIRMQQVARQLPPMPQFQDVQRQQMNDNSKLNDGDFERFMAMRDSDPRIQNAPQRF